MKKGNDLWEEYCGFFNKSFQEQLQYNNEKLQKHFARWKNTKMAAELAPDAKDFEEVPLTDYSDYPILHEFGEKVKKLSKTISQRNDELLWDYYKRISGQVSSMLDEWLPGDYSYCGKTSGTTGQSKWFAYTKEFEQQLMMDSIAIVVIGGSEEWGTTKVEPGDKILNILAPPPYPAMITGRAWDDVFNLVPSQKTMESTSNMLQKITLIAEMIKDGERFDGFGGVASPLKLICDYLKNPDELFKNYYQSLNFGALKIYLFIKYLKARLFKNEDRKLRDLLPLKGVGIAGVDAKLYFNYLREQFGFDPLNGYIISELGIVMYGRPENKRYLVPTLRSCYFEFLDEKGEINKLTEVKKGHTYELVGTSFGSMLIRYKTGDIFRVVDIKDNGMPIFDCEGRKENWLDFFGYFRVSERLMTEVVLETGLDGFEKWSAYKVTNPREKLRVLMENVWNCQPSEAAERFFKALKKKSPYFNNYLEDFNINDPEDIITVEYLDDGTFMRYIMSKKKEGVALGQIKPPKIISMDEQELVEKLRNI
ncbi:MAG TPA: GH3 auxin-responsive promoter family protein [bacterium]|nr:GH3 auxin-responsive promoter family protein [bacterium]